MEKNAGDGRIFHAARSARYTFELIFGAQQTRIIHFFEIVVLGRQPEHGHTVQAELSRFFS